MEKLILELLCRLQLERVAGGGSTEADALILSLQVYYKVCHPPPSHSHIFDQRVVTGLHFSDRQRVHSPTCVCGRSKLSYDYEVK